MKNICKIILEWKSANIINYLSYFRINILIFNNNYIVTYNIYSVTCFVVFCLYECQRMQNIYNVVSCYNVMDVLFQMVLNELWVNNLKGNVMAMVYSKNEQILRTKHKIKRY